MDLTDSTAAFSGPSVLSLGLPASPSQGLATNLVSPPPFARGLEALVGKFFDPGVLAAELQAAGLSLPAAPHGSPATTPTALREALADLVARLLSAPTSPEAPQSPGPVALSVEGDVSSTDRSPPTHADEKGTPADSAPPTVPADVALAPGELTSALAQTLAVLMVDLHTAAEPQPHPAAPPPSIPPGLTQVLSTPAATTPAAPILEALPPVEFHPAAPVPVDVTPIHHPAPSPAKAALRALDVESAVPAPAPPALAPPASRPVAVIREDVETNPNGVGSADGASVETAAEGTSTPVAEAVDLPSGLLPTSVPAMASRSVDTFTGAATTRPHSQGKAVATDQRPPVLLEMATRDDKPAAPRVAPEPPAPPSSIEPKSEPAINGSGWLRESAPIATPQAHPRTLPPHEGSVFAERLSQYVLDARDQGRQLSVQITPPDLGPLHIEVTTDGGRLTARLETASGVASQLLHDHLPQLQDALLRLGAAVDRIDIVRIEPDARQLGGDGGGSGSDWSNASGQSSGEQREPPRRPAAPPTQPRSDAPRPAAADTVSLQELNIRI